MREQAYACTVPVRGTLLALQGAPGASQPIASKPSEDKGQPKFSKWWIKYGNLRPLFTSSQAAMMLFVKGRGPQLKTPILLTWKQITNLPVKFPLYFMFPSGQFHFLWLQGMFGIESTYIAVFFLYKFEE